MILLDSTKLPFDNAIKIDGLATHYAPANIMISKATGDIGSLARFPVRKRVESGGFILMHVANIQQIEGWFNKRNALTSTLQDYGALQRWIVIAGVTEGNLFGTIGDTDVQADEFYQWITESRMAGCAVATVADYHELAALCTTIESVLINGGAVNTHYSVETFLSSVPHLGPIATSVEQYCGSVWAAIAFLTNKDLFSTLPLNPGARAALHDGYYTPEMHQSVRAFFGLENDDVGIGLYITE